MKEKPKLDEETRKRVFQKTSTTVSFADRVKAKEAEAAKSRAGTAKTEAPKKEPDSGSGETQQKQHDKPRKSQKRPDQQMYRPKPREQEGSSSKESTGQIG